MAKKLFKTDRSIHFEPRRELKYLLIYFFSIFVASLANEFLSEKEADYLRRQGKIAIFLIMIFVARIITFKQWGDKYKETLNYLFGSIRFDFFILVSILNIVLDFFVLFCFFFWIEIEKVSFIPVTVAGIVYFMLMSFSALSQIFTSRQSNQSNKKNRQKKKRR